MKVINYPSGKVVLEGQPNELAQFITLQEQIQFNINELFNQISNEEEGNNEQNNE